MCNVELFIFCNPVLCVHIFVIKSFFCFCSFFLLLKSVKHFKQRPCETQRYAYSVTPRKVTRRHRWPLTAEVIHLSCLFSQRNWFLYSWSMELLTLSSVYSRIFSKNSQARRWKQTHLCVLFSVSGVSSQLPLSASCPSMLALLTGYIILQYNSKGLWKAKIISIAAEGTKVAVSRSFLF